MRTIIVCLLLASHAAHADDQIWFGGGGRALRSSSADAVTSDGLAMGHLGYAHALALDVPGIAVWAETGFGWGSADGTMFQTMSTHIDTQTFIIGARAHYTLHRLIDATARFDVGMAHTGLEVATLSDSGWGALTQGALGLDFYAGRSPRFAIGLRTELGYTLTSGVALTPHADAPDGTLQIDMNTASIGRLDLSGPWAAISLVGAF